MAVLGALQSSVGQRGAISTLGLMALRLYAARQCLYVAANAAEVVARIATCGKNILNTAVAMPGWDQFGLDCKHFAWQVYQPTKIVTVVDASPQGTSTSKEVPNGSSLKQLGLESAKSLVKGIVAWDAAFLVAGRPSQAYSSVLSYLGPFMVNADWKGPLARILVGQFPTQVAAVQNFNFRI